MINLTLQDLVRIDSATANYTQPDSGWVGVVWVQDATFWVDVRDLTVPQGATLSLFLETAPERDDELFRAAPMVAGGTNLTALTTPDVVIVKVLLNQDPNVPVGRWIRWRLELDQQGAFDVTLRILACCNPSGGGR